MDNKNTPWRERFGLKTCAAADLEKAVPEKALGVAVIYAVEGGAEKTWLVVESRAQSLREQCLKRLRTAKLPPVETLTVAYLAEALPESTPEAVHAACREQVILAGALRRELRPAMR
jgi:hypothetical protein